MPPTGDTTSVLGLGFDTSRPPYVLRTGLDNPSREVPWREGTRTRSVNRFDLLKLLIPLAEWPTVSVLDGFIQVSEEQKDGRQGPPDELHWFGNVSLYIDCLTPVVPPNHRCSGGVILASGHRTEMLIKPGAATVGGDSRTLMGYGPPPSAVLAEQGHDPIVVHGSSPFWLAVTGSMGLDDIEMLADVVRLEVELGTAGLDPTEMKGVADLRPVPPDGLGPSRIAQWHVEPSS